MKDTLITVKQKKREIGTWLICFLIANIANIYAVIQYKDSSKTELITSLGYVFIASLCLYILWSFIRIIFYGVRKLLK